MSGLPRWAHEMVPLAGLRQVQGRRQVGVGLLLPVESCIVMPEMQELGSMTCVRMGSEFMSSGQEAAAEVGWGLSCSRR